MKAVLLVGFGLGLGASPALAAIKAAPVGCASFMKDYPAAVPGYRVSFERPLTISRGFGETAAGVDVRILSTNVDVDGTLKCRGDEFLRFEVRIAAPAKAKTLSDFELFERAAVVAALHAEPDKAQTIVRAMGADAAEYLRASQQRGDFYLSGKVEYHQADRLDLGLIWTETDHTFVVASQSDE